MLSKPPQNNAAQRQQLSGLRNICTLCMPIQQRIRPNVRLKRFKQKFRLQKFIHKGNCTASLKIQNTNLKKKIKTSFLYNRFSVFSKTIIIKICYITQSGQFHQQLKLVCKRVNQTFKVTNVPSSKRLLFYTKCEYLKHYDFTRL